MADGREGGWPGDLASASCLLSSKSAKTTASSPWRDNSRPSASLNEALPNASSLAATAISVFALVKRTRRRTARINQYQIHTAETLRLFEHVNGHAYPLPRGDPRAASMRWLRRYNWHGDHNLHGQPRSTAVTGDGVPAGTKRIPPKDAFLPNPDFNVM